MGQPERRNLRTQYFYEEQLHRMECLAQEPVLFEDVLCQVTMSLAYPPWCRPGQSPALQPAAQPEPGAHAAALFPAGGHHCTEPAVLCPRARTGLTSAQPDVATGASHHDARLGAACCHRTFPNGLCPVLTGVLNGSSHFEFSWSRDCMKSRLSRGSRAVAFPFVPRVNSPGVLN